MLPKLTPLLVALGLGLPAALCATHDIVAGQTGLEFAPSVTHASPGDTLVFHFYPGRHNVAQGSFSQPCQPAPGGFYSGYIVPESGEDTTTFEVKVNSTDPIWIYCSQLGHCQGGMVGVINPPSTGDQTLDAYAKAAQSASGSTTPDHVSGGVFGDSSTESSSSASASAPSSPASASSSPASSSSAASSSSSASAPASSTSSAATSASSASTSASGTTSGGAASASPTGAASHGFGAPGAAGVAAVVLGGWMGLL